MVPQLHLHTQFQGLREGATNFGKWSVSLLKLRPD